MKRRRSAATEPASPWGNTQPDPLTAQSIAQWVVGGMTHEQIASGLQMTVDALRKRYGWALESGANAVRGAIIEKLVANALSGNASSAKLLFDRAATETKPDTPEGKKAKANAEAKVAAAGTSWESLLEPKSPVQ